MVSSLISQKPVIRPQYVKGQIVESQGKLYESVQRPDGSYFWHFLSPTDGIDENGVSITPAINNRIGETLQFMFTSMRLNPQYKITSIDYDSFHIHRARFPLLWNEFLKLYRSRELNARINSLIR